MQGDARIIGILTIGSGSVTIDGSEEKVRIGTGVTLTSSGDSDFVGIVTAKGFNIGDDQFINVGLGSDLKITHTGSESIISHSGPGVFKIQGNGSNNTFLRAKSGENSITLVPDGEVILHHNNSVRAETSSTGLDVTGNLTATSFNVGTAATIASNGNSTFSGIVTASRFTGPLTGNVTGDASGNAGTATALETARNIGGVSFDGSANINLPGVNEAGNQNTSGTAAGLTGNPTITVTKVNVGTAATIAANGNATFSGIVTAASFTGDGTGLTGVASTDNIQTGTPATFLSNVNITGVTTATGGLHVGTAATIFANGNIAAGIVTASSFVGDGSGLSGVGATEEDTAVSSTSATTVLSFAKASYRAAFIKLTITQGSNYQSGKYSLIHDGTTVTVVEENAIATNSTLGTFSGTISGDNVLFQVTMGSSSSATVTLIKELITV